VAWSLWSTPTASRRSQQAALGPQSFRIPPRTLRSVGLSASRLVLERASSLDLYEPRTGAAVKSIALASDSVHELIGVTQRFGLLRTPRTFVLVRLADGARAPLALPLVAQRGLVGVRLTAAGLFYAYNVRNASVPGRVAFVPTRSLAAAFWRGRVFHDRDNPSVADGNRMIFLGFGKYARADKIYAIEPIRDERRGHGRRTLVWVEGVSDPIVASRT
jgi:hypothetical protein